MDFKDIKNLLENDKIFIYPTESLYGIGCKFDSKKAIERIYSIKGRDNKKPFLLLVGSWKMAEKIVIISNEKKEFLKRYWPGHLTVIFNSIDKKSTIAIRYPDTDFLNELFKYINFPIISTSVNRSGKNSYTDIVKIKDDFKNKVDFIIDLPTLKKGKASTIIDFTKDTPIVIRNGDLKIF